MILVLVSGAPVDEEAVRLAVAAARGSKARVDLLYVVEVGRALPLDTELTDEIERGEGLVARAQELARKEGCFAETSILQSRDVGVALVDEANEVAAGLIVLGVPVGRSLDEFELPDTARYVLRHATCSVWLARERAQSLVQADGAAR